jgi:antitoxin CcdA
MCMKNAAQSRARKPINVSLDSDTITEAKALGIIISQACEHGLVIELSRVRNEKWLEENLHALEAWNVWIEENGLPLEEYRQF